MNRGIAKAALIGGVMMLVSACGSAGIVAPTDESASRTAAAQTANTTSAPKSGYMVASGRDGR